MNSKDIPFIANSSTLRYERRSKQALPLRLISASCNAGLNFSIDGHNFTIIETDGINIQPITVNSLPILASQRFSVILETNQPVDNYWIRSEPSVGIRGFKNGINSAVLRYEGADDSEPTTSMQSDIVSIREVDLHPLESPGAPGEPVPGGADLVLNITLSFDANTSTFLMNGVQFVPPTVPVLLQILSGAQRAQDLLPKGSVYTLPLNKTIEINLFGGNAIDGPVCSSSIRPFNAVLKSHFSSILSISMV